MRPPESRLGIWGLVLGALGGVFLALGTADTLLRLFFRHDATVSAFLPIGGMLWAAWALCRLILLRRRAQRARLLARGHPVQGTVLRVDHHVLINWNLDAFSTFPGQNSPWSILCRYQWAGQSYTVRTPLLWGRPKDGLSSLPVYIDPDRPRQAAVDVEQIPLQLFR